MKRIIVDVNALANVFSDAENELSDLKQAILYGVKFQVALSIGGKLFDEYYRKRRMHKFFAELRRSGKLLVEPRAKVDSETSVVAQMNCLESDDPHIIALARVAMIRILCTFDQALESDFKKKELISKPKGKIYKDRSHNHILR